MLNVQIKVTGTDQEITKLRSLGSRLEDFSDAMKTIGNEAINYFSGQVFASQGGVFGTPWESLSPVYKLRKAVGNTKYHKGRGAYPGRGVLVKTGTMQQSFVAKSSASSVTIGNTAPYFAYHQSSASRSKLPRRQMIGVNDDVRSIVKQVLENDIQNKLKVL